MPRDDHRPRHGALFRRQKRGGKKAVAENQNRRTHQRRPRRAFEPSVLFLTRKGLMLLQEKGDLTKYPSFDLPVLDRRARVSDLTIRHELEIMDVKAAFHAALAKSEKFAIEQFSTWPLLNEFTAYRPGGSGIEIIVKPDSFIRIHETDAAGDKFERAFFLKWIVPAKSRKRLLPRLVVTSIFTGAAALPSATAQPATISKNSHSVCSWCSRTRSAGTTPPTVASKHPAILTMVYLSTLEEVTHDPTGAIWIRPLDYRAATEGTPFAPEKQPKTWGYQRQTAREHFVEQKVQKQRILADDAGA